MEQRVEAHPEFLVRMKRDMEELRETSGEGALLSPDDMAMLDRCLEPHDWRLLACIWIYDPKTLFRHSLSTFKIASRKFEREFRVKGISIPSFGSALGEEIGQEESFAVREFLRACVLHDVGKITIATSVIENSVQDTESLDCVARQLVSGDIHERARGEELLRRMVSQDSVRFPAGEADDTPEEKVRKAKAYIEMLLSGKRINMFMPIKELFRIEYRKKHRPESSIEGADAFEEEMWINERIHTLEQGGFHGDMTLKEILDTHQLRSERILMEHGDYFAALFAGHHHSRSDAAVGVRGEVVAMGADEHAGESRVLMREFFERIGNHAQAIREKVLTSGRERRDSLHVMRVAPVVIRFCDVLDALTDPTRPYKRGMTLEEALESMSRDSHREPEEFSPAVVALCMIDEIISTLKHQEPVSLDNTEENTDNESTSLGELLHAWKVNVEKERGDMAGQKADKVTRFALEEMRKLIRKMEEGVGALRDAVASS